MLGTNAFLTGPQMPLANTGVNLHLSNLDTMVDDKKLLEIFSPYGKVLDVKIRESFNNSTQKFGFVTMATQAEAEKARQALNHVRILRKEVVISFNKRPGTEADPKANLIIRGLNKTVGGRDLEQVCAEFGPIVTCKVKDDESGQSLGYGYVQFEKAASAADCIAKISANKRLGDNLSAEEFKPMSKRMDANQKSNLYIKQFPEKMTQAEIESFIETQFGALGKIQNKGVFPDPKLGKFYSFVAFETAEAATAAKEKFNGHEFPESSDKLYVDFAQSKIQRRQMLGRQNQNTVNETNLYIRSLKPGTTQSLVQTVFSKFGIITSVSVKETVLDSIGSSGKRTLGSAFINFKEAADAKRAFELAKKDEAVLDLLDPSHNRSIGEFLFFKQAKTARQNFLKMQQKKSFEPTGLASGAAQMEQFMKMMMMIMQFNGGMGKKPRNDQQKPKRPAQPMPQIPGMNFSPMIVPQVVYHDFRLV